MTRKEEIKEQISKLQNELQTIEEEEREIERKNWNISHKYCIVCKNRDKKNDFFIPDGIICTHPTNQEGKNKYQSCHHTCEFWEQEN